MMKTFKAQNTFFGWIAFVVAAFTYLSTMEPTASFWDCGEFIASAYKLEVGHPPGAPFFMLTARIFSLFATDPSMVALMVNTMSALASAFTILFLFWTITHLAQSVITPSEEGYSFSERIAIFSAGMVGALAYTFSDTFWFSATEGEVYAYSSLFTALVFWVILRWERTSGTAGSDRWLILVAYLMGLSIGVHLLNLLAIPAIVLVYYFRNFQPSTKGIFAVVAVSLAILVFTLYGLIPGFTTIASQFELFFVNSLGMPFNTGVSVYLILLVGAVVWAIYETHIEVHYVRMALSYIVAITLIGVPFLGASLWIGLVVILALFLLLFYKREWVNTRWLNTSIIMMAVMLIGYSSYTLIVIRSAANPPMDQNSPDNVFALKSYLNREQYGDRPLLYGAVYNAPLELKVEGDYCVPVFEKTPSYAPKIKTSPDEKDSYTVTAYRRDYKRNDDFMMLFPRMYSSEPSHVSAYKMWGKIEGTPISYDICGRTKKEIRPTFIENMRFFFDYQVNFMYWRYFLWNFSGRQNDIQGFGEIDHGNWITGIKFIDNLLVGNQDNLPTAMKENKGRNTYYLLPLLLGLLGVFFQLNRGQKGVQTFWVTFLLFFMTGLAIVIYLNQTPYQPRERDYAYVGSFYAFSIWIGLGVLAIYAFLSKILGEKGKNGVAVLAGIACLGVPALMAEQNWDDHDRSGRYVARDFGQNYLNSCEPNAIIFSNGDNDTFPLWYNQEVEGVRTDVRVCNLSYLQTQWYIDQMKREAYTSAPLPISWKEIDYMEGKNEVIPVEDALEGMALDMQTAFDYVLNPDPETKMDGDGFFPTGKLHLPVDANEVIATGTMDSTEGSRIVPQMLFSLSDRITKSSAMTLEMLKENRWKRPMYMAVTVSDNYYPKDLNNYFERTGMAYRILPIKTTDGTPAINTEVMYDNIMHKFKFGGIDNPKVYLDDNILRMCRTHRVMFASLIEVLVAEKDSVRAEKAFKYCQKMIPGTTVPHDYTSVLLAKSAYNIGLDTEGTAILNSVAENAIEYLVWYSSLTPAQMQSVSNRIGHQMAVLNEVLTVATGVDDKIILNKYVPLFNGFVEQFNMK